MAELRVCLPVKIMKFIGFFVFSFLLVLFVGNGLPFDRLTTVCFVSALALFMLRLELEPDRAESAQFGSMLLFAEFLVLLLPILWVKILLSLIIFFLALLIVKNL